MHQSPKKTEWSYVPRRRWNIWQRLADRTDSVVTPGNAATVLGFGLVLIGLAMIVAEHYWSAVLLIGMGRLCDLLDGWLADETATKSPLGEMLDAGVDKIETALMLIVLVMADFVSAGVVLAVLLPQIAITLLVLASLHRGIVVHPSRSGKYSMATAWLGLVGFVLVRALELGDGVGLWLMTYGLVGLSVLLSVVAVAGYIRTYWLTKSQ